MPPARHQLGNFYFTTMHGFPAEYQQEIELQMRPGVEGVGIWKTGRRGRPFQLFTTVDCPNLVIANDVAIAYKNAIGGPLLELIDGDLVWLTTGLRFAIIDCRVEQPIGLCLSVGGLNPGAQAYLAATWTLVPINTNNNP